MKIPCKSIFLALLLLAEAAGAYADPGQNRDARDARQQDQGRQRNEAGRAQNEAGANPDRRAPPRSNSHMTPEERSALRRQINEAGQDIYSGKYKR